LFLFLPSWKYYADNDINNTIVVVYMQDNAAFYTSSHTDDEYDVEDAEDEIVQVLGELQLTINNQSRH
jgi:hypothetical protein